MFGLSFEPRLLTLCRCWLCRVYGISQAEAVSKLRDEIALLEGKGEDAKQTVQRLQVHTIAFPLRSLAHTPTGPLACLVARPLTQPLALQEEVRVLNRRCCFEEASKKLLLDKCNELELCVLGRLTLVSFADRCLARLP